MRYFYIVMMLFLFISCKSAENNVQTSSDINFNEGWVNENKFAAVSIGYPNGYSANKDDATYNEINNCCF